MTTTSYISTLLSFQVSVVISAFTNCSTLRNLEGDDVCIARVSDVQPQWTHFSSSTVLCAFESKVLLHLLSSFSGTDIAVLTVCTAVTAFEAIDVGAGVSQ